MLKECDILRIKCKTCGMEEVGRLIDAGRRCYDDEVACSTARTATGYSRRQTRRHLYLPKAARCLFETTLILRQLKCDSFEYCLSVI